MRRTVLVLGLVACGGSAPPVAEVSNPAEVTVLDAGAEPRQLLRVAVPAHTSEREVLQISLSIRRTTENTVLETGHESWPLPMVRAVARLEVTNVAPDGTMTVHVEMESATYDGVVTDPRLRQAADLEVSLMRRIRFDYQMSPAGRITRIASEPEGLGARAFDDAGVVFPDVPVGAGASWRVSKTVSSRGVTWNRSTTFHLRSFDDAGASVEIDAAATAPTQAVTVNPRSSEKITGGQASGHGLYLIPLHRLAQTGGGRSTVETARQLVKNDLRIRATSVVEEEVAIKPLDEAATP